MKDLFFLGDYIECFFYLTTGLGKVMENMHGRKGASVVINRRVGMTSPCFSYTGIRSSRDTSAISLQFS